MKKYGFLTLLVILAMLLSSCQLHTGLGKLLNGGGSSSSSSSSTNVKKHIKATHTPPSAPTHSSSAPSTGSTPAAVSASAVTISSSGFAPNPLQIKVGTTVTWTNTDSAAHTVTSDTGLFDSGPINSGGTYIYTFSQAGTFGYHSTGDANLTGSITVTP